MPASLPVLSQPEILAAHGQDGLYVRREPSSRVGDANALPSGTRGIALAGYAPAEAAPGERAEIVRPTRVASRRVLDSGSYGNVRFNLDFIALSQSHGRQAHQALRSVLGPGDGPASPFATLCETTRLLAERSALAHRIPGGEGAAKAWSLLLQGLGYDVVIDRGQGFLTHQGTEALFLRQEAVEPVAVMEDCTPVPDAPGLR